MVRLIPMSADRWTPWREAAIRDYAGDKVRVGAWPEDDALDLAKRDFQLLLPEGQATPGHQFRSIVTEEGTVVGTIWFGRNDELARDVAFIWDIVVDAPFRGRGFGRTALAALEPVVRELGFEAIALHVFGDNEIARNLYRTSGYVETDVSMTKRLG